MSTMDTIVAWNQKCSVSHALHLSSPSKSERSWKTDIMKDRPLSSDEPVCSLDIDLDGRALWLCQGVD